MPALTFAAPPCRPHDSRSGGLSAAPHPTDAPSGSWPPARLCPAGRRLRAQLPHERRRRASDLSGAEDKIQDISDESSFKNIFNLSLDSLRPIFYPWLHSQRPSLYPQQEDTLVFLNVVAKDDAEQHSIECFLSFFILNSLLLLSG